MKYLNFLNSQLLLFNFTFYTGLFCKNNSIIYYPLKAYIVNKIIFIVNNFNLQNTL